MRPTQSIPGPRLGHFLYIGKIFIVSLVLAFPLWAIQDANKDYLEVPDQARPMEGLLPTRGVDVADQYQLEINSKYLKTRHDINFDTREVEIVRYLQIEGAPDSSVVHTAYYRELSAYAVDLNQLAMYRLWLNGLIGQADPHAGGGTDSHLQWELPVAVPEWLKRIGADRPKLKINGSYKVRVKGKSQRGFKGIKDRWFPNFSLENEPAFSVVGSIGRLIHIEINNEEGFGTSLQDQLKIAYRGEGDELEDNIVQEVEVGNTSLALTGSQLAGYTENHKGLFGIKARFKLGNLHITTIASQEGGSQERQTLGTGLENTEFDIEEKNISLYKHFFLEIKDRRAYADPQHGVGTPVFRQGKSGVQVEVYEPTRSNQVDNLEAPEAVAFALSADSNIIESISERGRWVRLESGEDYIYNPKLRMLTVFNGRASQALAVRWNNDPLVQAGGSSFNRDTLILLKQSTGAQPAELDSLMWRNVYNIGKVSAEDRDKFKLRVVDHEGKEILNKKSFAEILGLTQADDNSKLAFSDENIFDFENGLLILPCHTQDTASFNDGNCLTPIKRINPVVKIYEQPADELNELNSKHKFSVVGKQRRSVFDVTKTSHSTSAGGCLDITPGTERLMLNGSTELIKDVDYEVLYEVGQITLLSLRAKAPNNTIDISYECTPLFQIQDRILLGTRLEYDLDMISEESMMGATVLFQNQSTTSRRPQLGREPFRQFLWGFNSRLAGSPHWMTDILDFVPFLKSEADSKVKWEFEMAQSFYNPNTKGGALLDDFENSKRNLDFPQEMYSWTQASPPGNRPSEIHYDANLDYRHMGEFIWHSSIREQFSKIFGTTSSSRTNNRELKLLKFTLRPNDNLRGNSWGGVMYGFSSSQSNQSRKRILELVIRGREGKFIVDIGKVSEDLSIAGFEPNGVLDAEVLPGEFTNEKDYGLDGLKSGEGEVGQRWECKPTCFPIPYPNDESDPARDDWRRPETGETDPPRKVNGTEGNDRETGGFTFDTEDMNRNGVLDLKNQYARYAVDLTDDCTAFTYCEFLENGWRKYQIPLYDSEAYEILSEESRSIRDILSDVNTTRVWMGELPNGVSESQVLIARMSLFGNNWEESDRNTQYEVPSGHFITGQDGSTTFITLPPETPDSNSLRVSVINNQEEKDLYTPSPNTKIERDLDTDEPLKEQSLVLGYENLHPGETVHATRLLAGDDKDLTLYSRMRMEVRPAETGVSGQNQVSFALQMGREDGNEESVNFYEIKVHLDTNLAMDLSSDSVWLRHAFNVELKELAALKNQPIWQETRRNSKNFYNRSRGDSSLTLSVVGDPSLSRINWMRLLVSVDSGAVGLQEGEIWVNDLRLEGINKNSGTAFRTSLQTDFSDFINISGNLTATNGNFITMTASDRNQLTPANFNTEVNYNTNFGLFANKFFPDEWGVSIPINLAYSGRIQRPFTKPASDIVLRETGVTDIYDDFIDGQLRTEDVSEDRDNRLSRLYQEESFTEKFAASYKKERRSKNFLVQTFLERPEIQYSYSLTRGSRPTLADTTSNYNTKLYYNLTPYTHPSWQPFSHTDTLRYVPKFISDFRISPFPERVNLTLADLSFVHSKQIKKDIDGFLDPVLEDSYTVELSHGFDFAWRPLNFLNFSYRISTNRDFDDQHVAFAKDKFFTQEENGLFYYERIFDFDEAREDPNRNVDDVYGILFKERNRNQTFSLDFNPTIISWLTTGVKYNSGYKHTRAERSISKSQIADTIPEHFDASSNHDIQFNAGLSLSKFFHTLEDVSKPLPWMSNAFKWTNEKADKFRLRNIDGSYTISHQYNGEEFTLDAMNNNPYNVDPEDFYAYQLGWVYSPSVFYDYDRFREEVILGDGRRKSQFFDYLSSPMLFNNEMNHRITRTADLGSGFTIPGLDMRLTGNVKWSLDFSKYRDTASVEKMDTSLVWPDYNVKAVISNFAHKLDFLKKRFSSFSANSGYNYKRETRFNPFSSNNETQTISHNFNPLLKLAARTKGKINMENSLDWTLTETTNFAKEADTVAALETYAGVKEYPLFRKSGNKNVENGFTLRDIFSISYDLETQKGIQFWRWYVHLKNNLKLKATTEANYKKNAKEQTTGDETTNDTEIDEFEFKLRPEVKYQFTRKIDLLSFIQYIRQQKFHTPTNEVTHQVEVNAEFTMRF